MSDCYLVLFHLLILRLHSKRLSVLEEDSSGSVEDLEMFLADLHEIEMNYLQSTFDKVLLLILYEVV